MSSSAMRVPVLRRALLFIGVPILVILVTKVVAGSEVRRVLPASLFKKEPPPPAELVNVPVAVQRDHVIVLDDSLFGRSGKLRVRLLSNTEAQQVVGLTSLFGAEA